MSKRSDEHGPQPHDWLRTSSLIEAIGTATNGESIGFDELLDEFRERAFGALLLLVLLPTFIPVPIGIGAITGPFIALIGLQMLFTFQHPWLPGWIGRRRLQRATVKRFGNRFKRLLSWLEKLCAPRLVDFLEHRSTRAFTGLQMALLGFLLSLPIPFTNYPFGLILLIYAIALIERDGRLLLVGWVLGIGAIVASALLSSEVVGMIQRLLT
jgi:hypothetical protein